MIMTCIIYDLYNWWPVSWWLPVWLMTSCMVDDLLYDWWPPVWLMTSCMVDDLLYGWWLPVWLMISCMVDDLLYGWWSPVWLMTSCKVDDFLYDFLCYWGPPVSLLFQLVLSLAGRVSYLVQHCIASLQKATQTGVFYFACIVRCIGLCH